MRTLLLLSLLAPVGLVGVTTKTEVIQVVKEFTIPEGEIWEIVNFVSISGEPSLSVSQGTILKGIPLSATNITNTSGYNIAVAFHPGLRGTLQFAGPFTFRANCSIDNVGLITYKIFENGISESVSGTSSGTTIVIPENTAGNVSLILESSTDMVNWSDASLGQYEPSVQKRFFRLRAVQSAP